MREIYSCTNLAGVQLCQSILVQAGIDCFVADSGKLAGLGIGTFQAVWISNESDFAEAKRVVESNRKEINGYQPDWICAECAAANSYKIETCGKCGVLKPGLSDKSIYDIFDQVRVRPALYFGAPSITRLGVYIDGIHHGISLGGKVGLRDVRDFYEFNDWVADKLGFGNSTTGWNGMILSKCQSEEEAFDRFYVLLNEFREGPM